jgi:signal transduction histidine kinase
MLFGAVSADALGDLVWAAMAVALGDAARSRRLALIASEERAARAERTRELEAQRRVADERLRIARDVHDAIGHRLAVINVHAAVAERLVRSDPERAAAAVGHVRGAGVAVLDELSDLMGALRDPSEADPRDLEISVDRIPELIAEFGAAGMDIRARAEGSRQPLCLAGSQAAYRIVQESLTNASKHARCHPVRVSLSYGAEELTVEVSNALPERDQLTDLGSVQPPQETAHNGIAGMRERALGAGGTLVAGVDGDHFRVIARLPYGQDTSRCPGGEHIDD